MTDSYTKQMLGRDLKLEMEKGCDIVEVSRWAYNMFSHRRRELNEELQCLLEELFRMEDDPQFEYSEEELHELAEKLRSGC